MRKIKITFDDGEAEEILLGILAGAFVVMFIGAALWVIAG
jgi:hypothetical protein